MFRKKEGRGEGERERRGGRGERETTMDGLVSSRLVCLLYCSNLVM